MKFYYRFALLLLLSLPVISHAEENTENKAATSLRTVLEQQNPGIKITRVAETPIKGLYEVIVGTNIFYMDEAARYMMDGNLVDRKTRSNHTEAAKSAIRLSVLKDMGEDKMLVYQPKKTQHTLTIVTDIDCPYCRRLHNEMDQYLQNNVKVRYIFMPLKGQKDFDTTISVWCAKDRNEALDIAKAGGDVENKTCDNPIQEHMTVARQLGVRGTPAIILEDGQMLPGYVPVDKLVAELNKPLK